MVGGINSLEGLNCEKHIKKRLSDDLFAYSIIVILDLQRMEEKEVLIVASDSV